MAAWLTPRSAAAWRRLGHRPVFGDFPLEIVQKTLLFRCQLGLHGGLRYKVSGSKVQRFRRSGFKDMFDWFDWSYWLNWLA